MAKELELTGQTWKSVREYYGLKYKDFIKCLIPIRKKLDKMNPKKNYRIFLPKQVELIKEHMEGK